MEFTWKFLGQFLKKLPCVSKIQLSFIRHNNVVVVAA